ncbi:hypothetical protein [Rhizobiales bacterium 3FA27D7]|jgi:hypothetical protein|uniref:hypothetical protein n=1 Tax=Mesorhizobium sp. 2RAF21 TaxID=3232995 RepID=UPI0010F66C71
MLENLYELFCQWLDHWQLAHPKHWWTWWRTDPFEWSPYMPFGRKVRDEAGNLIEGNCMRQFRDGSWTYRPFTEKESAEDEMWHGVR